MSWLSWRIGSELWCVGATGFRHAMTMPAITKISLAYPRRREFV
jgi:hypothetical protein